MAGEDKPKEGTAGEPEDSLRRGRVEEVPRGLYDMSEDGEKAFNAARGDEEPICTEFSDGTKTIDLSHLFSTREIGPDRFDATVIGRTLLGKVMDALPIPAFLIDRSSHVTFANKACRRIDKHHQGIVGKPFAKLFPDRAAAETVESLTESIFSTRRPRCHVAWLQINSSRIWARVTLQSVRIRGDRFLLALVEDLTSEKGKLWLVTKYNAQLRDEIDRRQLAEQTLRQSEQRFELALKGADLAWWDWNLETGSLLCDSSFVGTLGYSADEIPPHRSSWDQLIHPDDVPRFAKVLKAHLENSTPILELEQRVRSKSGTWRWVLTRGRVVERTDSGQPLRASGTNLDITEMKKAQKKIDALTHALIQTQERERERIALDLHDQVAQDLSAVRLALNSVSDDVRRLGPELGDSVAAISEKVRDIARSVRDLSYELVPPGLDDLGLVSTVQQYCREFSARNDFAVEFVPEGVEELHLDFDTEINLFRVIQEALHNVAKHAQARNVVVRLKGSRSTILLALTDDGRGFDVKKESTAAIADKRMGLWCMEQRIGLLRGKIKIASTPVSGTEIVVEVPVGEANNVRQEKGPNCR